MNITHISKAHFTEIIPRAYLPDVMGNKLIVEIVNSENERRFAFLLPPEYKIKNIEPRAILEAAISKYFYIPLIDNKILKNEGELSTFINSFKKK